jgi:hypothetical protein
MGNHDVLGTQSHLGELGPGSVINYKGDVYWGEIAKALTPEGNDEDLRGLEASATFPLAGNM